MSSRCRPPQTGRQSSADIPDLTPKHIALVALPVLMEDLVRRACMADGTIEIDDSIRTVEGLCAALGSRQFDAVIAGAIDGDTSPIPPATLQLQSTLRLLLITARDGVAELFELLPHRTRLGDVTPMEIVRAVQDDRRHASAWAALRHAHRMPEVR